MSSPELWQPSKKVQSEEKATCMASRGGQRAESQQDPGPRAGLAGSLNRAQTSTYNIRNLLSALGELGASCYGHKELILLYTF